VADKNGSRDTFDLVLKQMLEQREENIRMKERATTEERMHEKMSNEQKQERLRCDDCKSAMNKLPGRLKSGMKKLLVWHKSDKTK